MVRVKQFADDLGISKNKAKDLINKGRSRKDGGSQILESVMKKPIYAKNGKFTKAKVKIEKILTESDKPKLRPKNLVKKKTKKKDPFRADKTESLDKEFSKKVAKQNEEAMKNVKKTNKKKDGGFPDLTGDNKVTQADILKGRGVPGFSRGGGMAIQGLGFKGIR